VFTSVWSFQLKWEAGNTSVGTIGLKFAVMASEIGGTLLGELQEIDLGEVRN
jgi:hypothetical protein